MLWTDTSTPGWPLFHVWVPEHPCLDPETSASFPVNPDFTPLTLMHVLINLRGPDSYSDVPWMLLVSHLSTLL